MAIIKAGTYRFNDALELLPNATYNLNFIVYGSFVSNGNGGWVYDPMADISYCYFIFNDGNIDYYGYNVTKDTYYSPDYGWDNMYYQCKGFWGDFPALKGKGQIITVTEDAEFTDDGGIAFVSWFASNVKLVVGSVTYKDRTITNLCAGQAVTLSCSDKTMSDDVVIVTEDDSRPVRVFYKEKVIAYLPSGSTGRILCNGMTMASDILVTVDLEASSEGLTFFSNGDGTCCVAGIGTCTDTDVVIPSRSPANDLVTSIGEYAFHYDADNVTSITIPSSVTSIDYGAFWNCKSLMTVIFEENSQLTSIGESGFYNCFSLTDIVIPEGVTTLGDSVFEYCTSLASINIPKSLEHFSRGMVEYCYNLQSITVAAGNAKYHGEGNCVIETATGTLILGCKNSIIPAEGVQYIGNGAFKNSGVTSIVIPASVTLLDWNAFENCKDLTNVTFSENSQLRVIEDNAFGYCSALTSITLPNNLNEISGCAFRNCSSLTSVILPSSLKTIGYMAFYSCTSLTSMSIPDSVTNIDLGAFSDCDSLGQVENGISYVDNWAVGCATTITSVSIREGTVGIIASLCCNSAYSAITSVSLPSSLKYICDAAFCECTGITSLNIPDSVVRIGRDAFFGCSGICSTDTVGEVYGATYVDNWLVECDLAATSVSIREGTVGIADDALSLIYVGHESPLVSVTIPEGLKYIGWQSLRGAKFTSITLPSSIVQIEGNAFVECELLTTINVPWAETDDRNTDAPWGAPNATINYNYIESLTFVSNGDGTCYVSDIGTCTSTHVVIPNISTDGDLVTSIGDQAFRDCASLSSVTIPDSVMSIDHEAFWFCTGLTSITIPDSVTSIGNSAFSGCTGLTSITVDPANTVYHSVENCLIETVSKTLIAGCKNSVIPADGSVTSIGSCAFYNCSKLTSITIPDSVTRIGYATFAYCTSLTSVTIPSSVTSISNSAFQHCSSLTSVTFGENSQLTSISIKAFSWCYSLTSIEIPFSVTSIEAWAFEMCSSLKNITIPSSVMSLSGGAFESCSSLSVINVPWSEDDKRNVHAPWDAPNAVVNYNYVES